MFCTGECKKKNKKCGLLLDIIMVNDMTGEQKVIEKCAFSAMFESLSRMEYADVRLQSSMDNVRNENVKCAREQHKTLAQGFLGLIHTLNENTNAEKKLKWLSDVIDTETENDKIELLEEE